MVDPYSVDETSDLPAEMVEDLQKVKSGRKLSDLSMRVLSLFDNKKSLTPEQIVVALFRIHNISVKRNTISNLLIRLTAKGHLKRLTRGVYSTNINNDM